MTVSSTSSRVVYAGNGSTTVFPFAFKVALAADLVVVFTDAGGSDFTLSPSQYAATGFGLDAGGSVTYPAPGSGDPAIASGTKLTIYRNVAVTQPTSISNQGAMWPQVIEGALDRLTYIAQRVTDTASRALVISPTDSASLNVLPNATTRANSVLGFDAGGQPYAATLTGSLVSAATWLVQNFLPFGTSAASARAALGAVGTTGNETIAGNKIFIGNGTYAGTNDFSIGTVLVQRAPLGDNTRNAASTSFVASALGGTALRSYLAGLGMANNAATPDTKIDVAAGVCADDGNALMLAVSASTIDCGTTGASGLDTGALANSTWYHVFAIGKTDGTTALLASTSLSAPTMPTGYTLKRRIGSFRTNGSAHIVGFVQDGDYFRWKASVLDVNGTNPGTAAVLAALSVPTGVRIEAFGNIILQTSTTPTSVLLSDPAANDEAPFATTTSTLAIPGFTYPNVTGGTNMGGPFATHTDSSARIRYRLSGSAADVKLGVVTQGWIDRRGRDN